jgi:hypothetical protein
MRDEANLDAQDTLLLAGGIALMVFGAGMLLASPVIRRTVLGSLPNLIPGQEGRQGVLGGIIPDVERYLKLKAM